LFQVRHFHLVGIGFVAFLLACALLAATDGNDGTLVGLSHAGEVTINLDFGRAGDNTEELGSVADTALAAWGIRVNNFHDLSPGELGRPWPGRGLTASSGAANDGCERDLLAVEDTLPVRRAGVLSGRRGSVLRVRAFPAEAGRLQDVG